MSDMINEMVRLFTNEPVAMVGCGIAGIGLIALAVSSISYRFRAFTNKKAWGGLTLPWMKFGLLFLIVGAVLFLLGIYVL